MLTFLFPSRPAERSDHLLAAIPLGLWRGHVQGKVTRVRNVSLYTVDRYHAVTVVFDRQVGNKKQFEQ